MKGAKEKELIVTSFHGVLRLRLSTFNENDEYIAGINRVIVDDKELLAEICLKFLEKEYEK